ncbi:MAG: hypothetical protein R3C03_11755 [Pirellulaceae bacterium]
MRKYKILICLAALTVSGCANGPIRNLFRGAPCSTCNPPFGSLFQRSSNTAGTCNNGTCGVTTLDNTAPAGSIGSDYYPESSTPPVPGAVGQTGAGTGDTYPYPANRPVIGGAGFEGYTTPPTGVFNYGNQ